MDKHRLPSAPASGLPQYEASIGTTSATTEPPGIKGSITRPLKQNELTADILSDSILDFCNEHGDLVTNAKLQKLLYYAQAWYLALHGKALFPDRFEAWMHGPVQPEVYARFSRFGPAPIVREPLNLPVPSAVKKHIADVMESYGPLSSFQLELLSCDEQPWRKARNGLAPDAPSNAIIDTKEMLRFYKARLNEQEKKQT